MKKIAVYSPAAAGNVGHGFIYALKLCSFLSKENNLVLFTLNDSLKIKEFNNNGIKTQISSKYLPGSTNKNRFNRFGIFKEPIYGFYRMIYNYSLLKEFYKKNHNINVFHLLEFEYLSAIWFFIFHRNKLKKTILGFHSIDFRWIKERTFPTNIYKAGLWVLIPFLIKKSKYNTVHGDYLKNEVLEQFNLNSIYQNRIINIKYGCNIRAEKLGLKEELRKKMNLKEDCIIGLFFGVIRSDKGLLELLDVFTQIDKKVILFIAGSEGDIKKDAIEKKIDINNIKDRVICDIRYIREEEIAEFFYISDFVFITHTKAHIAFSGPLSLSIEFNRPVIASEVGEIKHFVNKNENGVLFKVGDYNDLVEKTNSFLSDLSKWKNFNFEKIQLNNSWHMMAQKIENLYNN